MQLRFEKRMVSHMPWALLGLTFAIALLGIWNLASAARPPHNVWGNQMIYLAVALLAGAGAALVDIRWLQRMAPALYVINVLALLALRFFGHSAKGADRWFALGPIRVQPSEFVKIALVLMLAKFFHDSYRANDDRYGLARLSPALALMGVPFVLVLLQPDLGTSLIILLTFATVAFFARLSPKLLAVLGLGFALGVGVLWNDFIRDDPERTLLVRQRLKPHQSQRILSWLQPESDLRGANYHSAQSKIAVGSGGLTGKGWRQGTQTGLSFLPEQHTDFIFSVWAEEHGFLACLGLLVLYGLLLVSMLGVAFNSRDRFGAFLAVGIAALVFWHVFENIGMVIGLLPVTGLTLPLFSYGGSSMVSMMILIGLLVNVSMRRHIF